jgi:predicted MFS family arabinose efflux permease
MLLLQSLYLQGVLRYSILLAGALLVPLGASTLTTSTLGGRLADRVGWDRGIRSSQGSR